MIGYVDAFEEASLPREFVGILDYVDSTFAVVERYRPPPVIVRTLIHDGFRMLDDFARVYRGLFKCTTTNKVFNRPHSGTKHFNDGDIERYLDGASNP